MILEARGLIYDATRQSADRRIAFFTSLCRLESGAFLCVFQVGSGKHSVDSTLALCRSGDGGATWQQIPARFETTLDGVPGSLSAPTALEAEPGGLQLFATWFDRGDPDRPLFDPVTEGILHSKLLRAVSDDGGETWSPWQQLATPELSGCSLTGPAIRWTDGLIALPFESFKEFDDPRPARHGSWVMLSRDGGRMFGAPLLLAPRHETYYWDARLCPAEQPGGFVALYWTHDRRAQRAASYAKRFAAKEACAKALGTGFSNGVFWRDMGVVNLPSGRPTLALTGGAAAVLQGLTPEGYEVRIDLTITDDFPSAQAIVLISALKGPVRD